MAEQGNQQGFAGQQPLAAGTTPYNAMAFVFEQLLARAAFCKVVEVKAVDSEAKTVDVLPLLKQVDGLGNTTEQLTVFGLPYIALQAGTTAVEMTPVVGDRGLCIVVDRDISSLKENKAPSQPGSRRRNSISDGVYIAGLFNEAAEQYVRIAPEQITIKAPTIAVEGDLTVTGNISAQGDVQAGNISLKTHRHIGVTTGGGTSGTPVP